MKNMIEGRRLKQLVNRYYKMLLLKHISKSPKTPF